MEKTTVVGVDIAKTVFEIAVSDVPGQVARTRRLPRSQFRSFFVELQPATVVMEACGSAHYWAREFEALGHTVVLLPPHLVRPYITRNKTDRADAKGILEAYRNEEIHRVPIKTISQQVIGATHRFRSGWIATRTRQANAIRGMLRELGFTIPVGIRKVVPQVRILIEDADSGVPDALRTTLAAACDEVESLGERIKAAERELETLGDETPVAVRIRQIPGVGLLTGTAVPAFAGDMSRFPSGRHFASYLGITPRERSSGNRRRLGGISKRGDAYLRTLFIHGARSILTHAAKAKSHDRLRAWALKLQSRTKHNVAVVALANRLARIVWAVAKHDRPYVSLPSVA
jgi:transposase